MYEPGWFAARVGFWKTRRHHMQLIASAATRHRLDTGRYARSMTELRKSYPGEVHLVDGWGNPFRYAGDGELIVISLGADGAPGPDVPMPWRSEPYEADLMLQNGQFVQAPELR